MPQIWHCADCQVQSMIQESENVLTRQVYTSYWELVKINLTPLDPLASPQVK